MEFSEIQIAPVLVPSYRSRVVGAEVGVALGQRDTLRPRAINTQPVGEVFSAQAEPL